MEGTDLAAEICRTRHVILRPNKRQVTGRGRWRIGNNGVDGLIEDVGSDETLSAGWHTQVTDGSLLNAMETKAAPPPNHKNAWKMTNAQW